MNNLSSKFYSRIFVGCYLFVHEYLKQSIYLNCPRCYSSSLRYSIYKVQNFTVLQALQAPFIGQLAYDNISNTICQYFFSKNFNFFSALFYTPKKPVFRQFLPVFRYIIYSVLSLVKVLPTKKLFIHYKNSSVSLTISKCP